MGGGVATVVEVHPTWCCTPLFGGLARWVGGRRWQLSRRRRHRKRRSFWFPWGICREEGKIMFLFVERGLRWF